MSLPLYHHHLFILGQASNAPDELPSLIAIKISKCDAKGAWKTQLRWFSHPLVSNLVSNRFRFSSASHARNAHPTVRLFLFSLVTALLEKILPSFGPGCARPLPPQMAVVR
jgi:hypothetical protein